MTPRPLPPDQIKTPPTSIGIYEFEGGARDGNEAHDMTIERALVIAILIIVLVFAAERLL